MSVSISRERGSTGATSALLDLSWQKGGFDTSCLGTTNSVMRRWVKIGSLFSSETF